MTQTKMMSLIETITHTIAGFITTFLIIKYLLPFLGYNDFTYNQSFQITLIFTTINVLRGYYIRRFFNSSFLEKIFKLS